MVHSGAGAYPPGGTEQPQWRETPIMADLVPGRAYEVGIAIRLPEAANPPNVKNPDVTGTQVSFVY